MLSLLFVRTDPNITREQKFLFGIRAPHPPIVGIALPSHVAASARQLLMHRPSTMAVHARRGRSTDFLFCRQKVHGHRVERGVTFLRRPTAAPGQNLATRVRRIFAQLITLEPAQAAATATADCQHRHGQFRRSQQLVAPRRLVERAIIFEAAVKRPRLRIGAAVSIRTIAW